MICERLEMLPIECVVRGYLAGSGLSDYLATGQIGDRARALFAELYRALSAGADAYVSQHFVSARGSLPPKTAMIERRLELLTG